MLILCFQICAWLYIISLCAALRSSSQVQHRALLKQLLQCENQHRYLAWCHGNNWIINDEKHSQENTAAFLLILCSSVNSLTTSSQYMSPAVCSSSYLGFVGNLLPPFIPTIKSKIAANETSWPGELLAGPQGGARQGGSRRHHPAHHVHTGEEHHLHHVHPGDHAQPTSSTKDTYIVIVLRKSMILLTTDIFLRRLHP